MFRLRFLTRRHAKMGHLLLVDLRLALDSMSSRSSDDLTEGGDPNSFQWPGEAAVRPEALPALAKNIAKNFMDHFFKGEGRAIVCREVD